jgi:hypothetical protein
MKNKQLEIGNRLLQLFIDNDGQMSDKSYADILKVEFPNENLNLIYNTATILIDDFELIRRGINNTNVKKLTAAGYRAADIGLKEFIREYYQRKELETQNLKANIQTAKIAKTNSKYSLTISILALVVTALVPVLSKIIDNHDNKKTSEISIIGQNKNNAICDTVYIYINENDSSQNQINHKK